MSQKNVEIVRRILEAFEVGLKTRDWGAAWETGAVAADVEFVAFAELERRSYRGRAGFVEFMSMWTEDFADYSIQTERLIDAPGDSVVALFTQSATGKVSGAPVVQEYAFIYDLADGQLVRMRGYLDRAEALKAVELSE